MIIGLDLGTTSISAVLFDAERSAVVGSGECANDATIAGLADDSHEQCASTIFAAASGPVASLVQKAGVSPEQIAGLAITGQQHGLVVVDRELNPLTNFTSANLVRAFANGIAGELAGAAREMSLGRLKNLPWLAMRRTGILCW